MTNPTEHDRDADVAGMAWVKGLLWRAAAIEGPQGTATDAIRQARLTAHHAIEWLATVRGEDEAMTIAAEGQARVDAKQRARLRAPLAERLGAG